MTKELQRKTQYDHLEDASEHTFWLQDVEHWRADHRRLIELLAKSQMAVLEQDAALEGHVAEIHAHEMHRLRHEVSMNDDAETPEMAEKHKELEAGHARARAAYQRMAEHHERIGRLIEELQRGLNKAM